MKFSDERFEKVTFVFESVHDEIKNSYLNECKIVSRIGKILFLANHITTEKSLQQTGRKPSEKMPVVSGCVLMNCELPEGCYEQNYIEKPQTFSAKNVSIP
jgi:hypothetical protein